MLSLCFLFFRFCVSSSFTKSNIDLKLVLIHSTDHQLLYIRFSDLNEKYSAKAISVYFHENFLCKGYRLHSRVLLYKQSTFLFKYDLGKAPLFCIKVLKTSNSLIQCAVFSGRPTIPTQCNKCRT